MLDDGPVVAREPLHRLLFGSILVLVDENESATQRLGRRLRAVNLAPDLVIDLEVFFDRVPWFLRDYEQPDTELRHYRHRFRRDCGGIRASLERFERERPNLAARLPGVRPAVHVSGLQGVDQQLGILDEQIPALILIETKAFVFDPSQAAPQAKDHPAIRYVVEHGDLSGHADRIVPWQRD